MCVDTYLQLSCTRPIAASLLPHYALCFVCILNNIFLLFTCSYKNIFCKYRTIVLLISSFPNFHTQLYFFLQIVTDDKS